MRPCRTTRGAGTSLAGGAIPQEDTVVISITKMNRFLELNSFQRTAKVQAGMTNLAISEHVSADGFFYAPDPSSQLACNIGMNSGGAHCLKYGVTSNHLLGVTLVMMDGTIVDIGGENLDSPSYDLLGLICGSEGQLGIITEATVRLIPKPKGARPVLFGFERIHDAASCVAGIIAAGLVPVVMEFMDKPAIEVCEAFSKASYPLDVNALLIIEVEGSELEIKAQLNQIISIAQNHKVKTIRESQTAMEAGAIWKGRKSTFVATGRVGDYLCMDVTIPTNQLPEALERISQIVAGYGLDVANVFHAGDGNLHPLILYNINDAKQRGNAENAGHDIL